MSSVLSVGVPGSVPALKREERPGLLAAGTLVWVVEEQTTGARRASLRPPNRRYPHVIHAT